MNSIVLSLLSALFRSWEPLIDLVYQKSLRIFAKRMTTDTSFQTPPQLLFHWRKHSLGDFEKYLLIYLFSRDGFPSKLLWHHFGHLKMYKNMLDENFTQSTFRASFEVEIGHCISVQETGTIAAPASDLSIRGNFNFLRQNIWFWDKPKFSHLRIVVKQCWKPCNHNSKLILSSGQKVASPWKKPIITTQLQQRSIRQRWVHVRISGALYEWVVHLRHPARSLLPTQCLPASN